MENKLNKTIDIIDELELSTDYAVTLIKVLEEYNDNLNALKKDKNITGNLFLYEHDRLQGQIEDLFNMVNRELTKVEKSTKEIYEALKNVEHRKEE